MNIVAAVFADFHETFLGGPSRLDAALGTRSVLAHTLARLARVEGLDKRYLVVRPRDADAARNAIEQAKAFGAEIELLDIDEGTRPRRELLRSARKWNLAGWRGTPLGSTWFDEYVEPLEVARVLDHTGCDAVLCLDGHQAALDVAISQKMLTHFREHEAEAQFVFTQAPPGLVGIALGREFTRELLEQQQPFGLTLAYRPERPRIDPITSPNCYRIAQTVVQTSGRFSPDTRRAREQLERAFDELGEDCTAEQLCDWSRDAQEKSAPPALVEVEIELTTADPLPETSLRPRGSRVPHRCLKDPATVERIAQELAEYDDTSIVLAGHGDPLLHPEFARICRSIRTAGVCGLAVVTPLVELSDESLAVLFDEQVDMLEVQIDATTAAAYEALHGVDAFERVLKNIERIHKQRQQRNSPQPILVPSMTRCTRTFDELEAFYEHWIPLTGAALLHGYNNYCGVLPDDTLLRLEPPVRQPCRRLASRLILLADGRAAACSQDIKGQMTAGRWDSGSLAQLWAGDPLVQLRSKHQSADLSEYPLCQSCQEWFRP